MTYIHPNDNNLKNLHKAMQYNDAGEPVVRTHVDGISLQGDVIVDKVRVQIDSLGNVLDENHSAPVSIGTNGQVTLKTSSAVIGKVQQDGDWTVKQGTTPWAISDNGGSITVDGSVSISSLPEVEIKNDSGNPIPVNGSVSISSLPEVEIKNDSGNPIPVNGSVSISSLPEVEIKNDSGNPIPVSMGFGAIDAFGRQRVSEPFTLGDYKHLYGIDPAFIDYTGNGGAIQFVKNKACCTLSTTSNPSSFIIHQTKFYHHYMPGKSQVIFSSINFGGATPNVVKRTGYFDDNDGIYFEQAGDGTLSWVIRSFVSGAPIEVRKTQSQWNLDTVPWLNILNTQLVAIDFQWLGVGRVRVGFAHDGIVVYVHEFLHSNYLPTVYMSNPNLPIRCEIRNVGATTGGSMDQICSTVFSEGGYVEAGQDWSTITSTLKTIAAGVTAPVMAIRLKNAFHTYSNRMIVRMGNLNVFSDGGNIMWRLIKLPAQSSLTGSTWVDVNTDSGVQYNVTATAWSNGQEMDSGFVGASTQGSQKAGGAPASNIPSSAKKNYIVQNFDSTDSEIFLVVATNLGAQSTNVGVSMQWREIY
jgi:hypothetical protein